MALGSEIEWTEATWNPSTGCTKVSTGCKNCYAEKLAHRLKLMGLKKYENEFDFTEHASDIDLPKHWKKPRKVFVNSMSDMFHEKSTFEFIIKCFNTMIEADLHTYQILTKRPHTMLDFSEIFLRYYGHKIPDHIWMGVSVEDEDFLWRIDELKKVQCKTRFVSFEPLIGQVGKLNLKGIDWAIIGGESGANFREVKKEWILEIIRQCKRQNVAVFFKQWGGFRPKSGGRMINGREYSEYPKLHRVNLLKDLAFDEKAFAQLCLSQELQKRAKRSSITIN